MVTIRLARHGAKKNPFYHITVADRAAKRDGRFIERIGFFDPLARGRSEPLRVDLARADYWLSVGARPSERVRQLLKCARAEAQAGVATQTEAELQAGSATQAETEAQAEAGATPQAEEPAASAPAPERPSDEGGEALAEDA